MTYKKPDIEAKKRANGKGKGNGKTPSGVGSEKESRRVVEKGSGRMNAIARGAGLELDLRTGYSKKVTQTTVSIARHLGIPEKEIQEWAAARARLDSERKRAITCSLNKLERSPLAQHIMGLTQPCQHPENFIKSRN